MTRQRSRLLPTAAVFAAALLTTGWLLPGGAQPQLASAEEATAPTDPLSRQQRARVELGRRLFFDPVASRSGARACSSCHDPDHGFSDPMQRSIDDAGHTVRHSQTLIDSRFNPTAHWDGEFATIEDLVTARIGLPSESRGRYGGGRSPITPGHSTLTPDDPELQALADSGRLALELGKLPRSQDVIEEADRYRELFVAGFGTHEVSRARIAEAIAAYCRTLDSTEAPYDRYVAGQPRAMSDAAVRGLALFKGKAGCAQCHLLDVRKARKALEGHVSRRTLMEVVRAPFTDFAFHNTGVAWLRRVDNAEAARKAGITGLPPTTAFPPPSSMPAPRRSREEAARRSAMLGVSDTGRMRISTARRDLRAFKTPTLRDIARRGPYMHDGRYATLEEVIRHYAAGGAPREPNLASQLARFEVTDAEVVDLVAFLEALSGDARPGLAPFRFERRVKKTRLRLLDGKGKPLAGLTVKLIPVGDTLPFETALHEGTQVLTTTEKGILQYTPGATTHMRLELPHQIQPQGGALVPDSCEKADVVIPVDGRIRFALTVEAGATVPATLRLDHQGTFVLPGHARPGTRLDLVKAPTAGEAGLALYEGWRRTDVPTTVTLLLPGGQETNHDVTKPATLRAKLWK